MTARAQSRGIFICSVLLLTLFVAGVSSGQQLVILEYDIGTIELDDLRFSLFVMEDGMPIVLSEPSFLHRPLDMVGARSGAAGWAMGGANVAEGEGVNSISWNPAGLGWLDRTDIAWDLKWSRSSGTTSGFPDTFNIPDVALVDVVRYEVSLQSGVRYNLMGAGTSTSLPGDRRLAGAISMRRYMDLTYPEEIVADLQFQEAGSFPVTVAFDGDEEGGVDALAATVGVEILPGIVSAGVNFNYLNGRLSTSEDAIVSTGGAQELGGYTNLRFEYSGFATDLGLQARLGRLASAGIRFTPSYRVEVTGGKLSAQPLPDVGSIFLTRAHARIASYDMEIPSLLSVGGTLHLPSVGLPLTSLRIPFDRMTFAGDVSIQNWSEFKIDYHDPDRPQDASLPLRDVTSINLGCEGRFLSLRGIELPVRVGYQTAPLSMAALEEGNEDWIGGDVDSQSFSFGLGFEAGPLHYDIGYQVIDYKIKKFYFDTPVDPLMNPEGTLVDVDRRVGIVRFSASLAL